MKATDWYWTMTEPTGWVHRGKCLLAARLQGMELEQCGVPSGRLPPVLHPVDDYEARPGSRYYCLICHKGEI